MHKYPFCLCVYIVYTMVHVYHLYTVYTALYAVVCSDVQACIHTCLCMLLYTHTHPVRTTVYSSVDIHIQ